MVAGTMQRVLVVAVAMGLGARTAAISLTRPRLRAETLRPVPEVAGAPRAAGLVDAEENVWASLVEHQMAVMETTLPDLVELPLAPHLAQQTSAKHGVSVKSRCYAGAGFRKVRMSCVDGGRGLQVFNSVWYPDAASEAPILGVDLLRFGPDKFLAVCDIQPLQKTEDYATRYTRGAAPIRSRYPELCGERSKKFYDDDRFFSDNQLYGRLEDESQIQTVVAPAFEEYLAHYLATVAGSEKDDTEAGRERVLALHGEYDAWNAERDPAHALFERYFGKEWAHEYLTEVLFELA